jgi:hypothetical protein
MKMFLIIFNLIFLLALSYFYHAGKHMQQGQIGAVISHISTDGVISDDTLQAIQKTYPKATRENYYRVMADSVVEKDALGRTLISPAKWVATINILCLAVSLIREKQKGSNKEVEAMGNNAAGSLRSSKP